MSKSKNSIKRINYEFNNNILPSEFTYNTQKKLNIDFNKLWYNDYYQSPEFIYKNLLPGADEIPYMENVITEMAKLILLPSEEMDNK